MRVACHRSQTCGACTFANRSLHTCRFRAWSFRTESWKEMASCRQKMVTIIEDSPAPDTRAKVKFVTAGHPETWGGCSLVEPQLVYSRIRWQEFKLNVDLKCVLPALSSKHQRVTEPMVLDSDRPPRLSRSRQLLLLALIFGLSSGLLTTSCWPNNSIAEKTVYSWPQCTRKMPNLTKYDWGARATPVSPQFGAPIIESVRAASEGTMSKYRARVFTRRTRDPG